MLEFDEEGTEGALLSFGTGVLGFLVVCGHASDVADAYGVLVVVLTVSTDLFLWASFVDAAIAVDDVVIADAFPASGFVPAVNVLDGVVLVFGRGGAVDDDESYLAHGGSGGFMVYSLWLMVYGVWTWLGNGSRDR